MSSTLLSHASETANVVVVTGHECELSFFVVLSGKLKTEEPCKRSETYDEKLKAVCHTDVDVHTSNYSSRKFVMWFPLIT
jgi:hypothetical protein